MAAKKTRTDSQATPPEKTRNFVEIADNFAAQAIADVDGAQNCYWMRLSASRYLRDRRRANEKRNAPFCFDENAANDPCDFIEKLPHVEGRWGTVDIVLHPAHIFFLVNLFGFRNHDGTRRFTTALLSISRKNAKSTIAAAILLYCLCCEDEPGAQVISAATTGSQARIVFRIAKAMVHQTPDLREAFGVEPFANAIANWDAGSNFRPINAKASTQDGLNPSHTCLDEIHAHKSPDLLNVLKSAAGARANPLWLYTTTEGYETQGPWPEIRKFAQQVLADLVQADHFFACIFALDDQQGELGQPGFIPADDDFDESKWVKANPLMQVNPLLEREIRKLALEAKQMPSTHAEFRIKRLNRQSAAANAWLNIERWKRCAGPVDLDWLQGKECWAALDGASTTDLMALRFVWRVDGIIYTWGMRWVPGDAVATRKERGTVPYTGWVSSGLLRQAGDGHTLDYALIEQDITEAIERFKPTLVAYDAWNLRDLISRLKVTFPDRKMPGSGDKVDSIFMEFRQGPKSFHPAMKLSEKYYLEGNVRHGGDAVLNWCAANVVARRDENLNMAPDRKRSADKIDDMVAFFMAIGAMGVEETVKKEYQLIFV